MNNVVFVILSFEGPDRYSQAGGLATRVTELSRALAALDFETHLFFVGDPALPGHEAVDGGRLILHRWCQWISHYHPAGVYDGEEGKFNDWSHSLPLWLEKEILEPRVARGSTVVIMAEEWQTVSSLIALREIVARRGWERQVHLLWNANNTFSFYRIDWEALKRAAAITTVSRYMKHVMQGLGAEAVVIPNGIQETWLQPLDRRATQTLAQLFRGRFTLVKVARWDPAKGWDVAVEAVPQLKRLGLRPLFLARGGMESYGSEVQEKARNLGLAVASVRWSGPEVEPMASALRPALASDMIVLERFLSEAQRRALFHTADVVLANSAMEPFGLVGLEGMAVGGVVFVGCTGEDYVTPSYDAISLQTSSPREVAHYISFLHANKAVAARLRRAARHSAAHYTWPAVIQRVLLPRLQALGIPIRVQLDSSLLPASLALRASGELPPPDALQQPGNVVSLTNHPQKAQDGQRASTGEDSPRPAADLAAASR